MHIEFATCDRTRALEFIQRVYPSRSITDAPNSAGPLLDLVEQDVIRIQDPMMYGMRIQVVPGTKWVEDAAKRAEITAVAAEFHRLAQGESE